MARSEAVLRGQISVIERLGIAAICRQFGGTEIKEALEAGGCGTQRYRQLSAEFTVYYVIAMALFMHVNIKEVLRCVTQGLRNITRKDFRLTGKSGISQARSRIGAFPLQYLYERHVRPIAGGSSQGAWFKGLRLVAMDSSTLDIRDEAANREIFSSPSTFNDHSPFPQLRFVTLSETGTHVLFGARLGDYKDNEVTLAHDVIPYLQPDMLCLADRGFFGYELFTKAMRTGSALLWRCRKDIKLPVKEVLPDGSYLSDFLPWHAARKKAEPILVRVIEYTVAQTGSQQEGEVFRLVTTLFDTKEFPATEIAALYHERWEIESAFDELKTHLRGQRLCLRSKTPELVRQEFYGLLLAHYTVRKLMQEAADKSGEDADRLSFTHAIQVIRRHNLAAPTISP